MSDFTVPYYVGCSALCPLSGPKMNEDWALKSCLLESQEFCEVRRVKRTASRDTKE